MKAKKKRHRKEKCSLLGNCGDQLWHCVELTELWRKYKCDNCGGTKTVFRNLYPGYQDGN